MSDNFRYRKEFNKPRYYAVDSATVIEVGDLLWHDTNDVKPASDFTWDTNIATTQRAFAKKFVGVAQTRSASGNTDPVQVNMAGVHQFACASAAHEIEDYLAPANSGSSTLEDQTVIKVTDSTLAIAKVAKREAVATTTVQADIIGGAIPGQYNSPEEIVVALTSLLTTARLSSDAIKDGTTSAVTPAAMILLLEALAGAARLSADAIKDGSTNVAFTATDNTKFDAILASKLYATAYTCVADDDTANLKDINTGFAVAPTMWLVKILRAGVDVTDDAIVTALGGGDAGKVRVADGGATYAVTANDVIHLLAIKV